MLINVVNPMPKSAKGFEQVMVVTHDGRAVSGLRFDQDQHVLVLRGVDGQNIPSREATSRRRFPSLNR